MIDTANEEHLTDGDFRRLSELIYNICGIHLVPAKKTMVELRLRKRLPPLRMRSFRAYCEYVFGPGKETEVPCLIDLITTNKTDFYREPGHFDYLTRVVLPSLEAGWHRPLQVWSAGCSTGEEPYSLAMVLSEYAAAQASAVYRFSVFASDISSRVLEKARLGVYETSVVASIPTEMRRKYLLRSRDRQKPLARVSPEIRTRVEFRHLNLMDRDFSLAGPMDVIFCRNVVIYFDKSTQERLVNKFARSLHPGGYLFMGHSETLHGFEVPLTPVAPTVYRKVA